MKLFIRSILALALLSACTKSELLRYDDQSDIYFYTYKNNSPLTDSVNISFAKWENMQDTVAPVTVRVLGKLLAQNRTYAVKVDESRSTAVAGTHFRLPSADSLYIRGGKESDTLLFQAMRPAGLRDKKVVLYLQLVPNENFKTGMPQYNAAVNATELQIVIDDILPQPANWAASEALFLGKYSREKITKMIAQLNLNVNKFYPSGSADVAYTYSELAGIARQFQIYLKAQAASGNIIREKDGSPMVLGTAV